MPTIPLNSKWFESYSKAVLESDLNVARNHLKNALIVIRETLKQSRLNDCERSALFVAVRQLRSIEQHKLKKAA